jgi:tetratricopeptide (TPR) repeat protein
MRARLLFVAALCALLVIGNSCGDDPLDNGEVLIEIGEYEKAVELADAEILKDAKNAKAHLLRGKARLHQDMIQEAHDAFVDAIAVGGRDTAQQVSDIYLSVFASRYSTTEGSSSFRMLSEVEDEQTLNKACQLVLNRLTEEKVTEYRPYRHARDYFSRRIGADQTNKYLLDAAIRLSEVAGEGDEMLVPACDMLLGIADGTTEQEDAIHETFDRKGLGFYRRARETMSVMRVIATATEAYAVDYSYYPTATSIFALKEHIDGPYVRRASTVDAWGNQLFFESIPTSYILISAAQDGEISARYFMGEGRYGREVHKTESSGATTDKSSDIIFSNGVFVQWPEVAEEGR